jgi:hypothetical protein
VHLSFGEARRQLDVDRHLRLSGDLTQRDGDERAVVEALGIDLRPSIRRAPGEHESLVLDDLAVGAARDEVRALVDDHPLAPDSPDA